MKSQRQLKLADSLKSDSGKVNPVLKDLHQKLKRFVYNDTELDLIEKQLLLVEVFSNLVKSRSGK